MPLALHLNADRGPCYMLHRVLACALCACWVSVKVSRQIMIIVDKRFPGHDELGK